MSSRFEDTTNQPMMAVDLLLYCRNSLERILCSSTYDVYMQPNCTIHQSLVSWTSVRGVSVSCGSLTYKEHWNDEEKMSRDRNQLATCARKWAELFLIDLAEMCAASWSLNRSVKAVIKSDWDFSDCSGWWQNLFQFVWCFFFCVYFVLFFLMEETCERNFKFHSPKQVR